MRSKRDTQKHKSQYQILVLTHRGFTDVCAEEMEELGSGKISYDEDCVHAEASPEAICSLIYRSQTAIRVLLNCVCADTVKELAAKIRECDFSASSPAPIPTIINGKNTFRLTAEEKQQEVIQQIAPQVEIKTGLKVDLENPDIVFFVFSGRKAYLGIDLVPFDMSKRVYKLFHTQNSIKGTLAACLIKWSGYNGEGTLIDPCTGGGVIPIEAALLAIKKSPHFFKKNAFRLARYAMFEGEEQAYISADREMKEASQPIYGFSHFLPYVTGAQKNAKIAGVEKHIVFSKYDIEWLDLRVEEGSVSFLVTHIPAQHQLLSLLLQQASRILKPKGILALLCKQDILSKLEGFSLLEKRSVYSGKQELYALKLQKI